MILTTVSVATFMSLVNISIVTVALPSIQKGVHTDLAGLQWVVNAFTICLSALTLTGGSLGDRYGRRRLFVIGVAGFIVGSVICALSSDLPTLLGGRFVQGVAAAVITPGALSIITQTFTDPAERARKIGAWASVAAVGLVVGPVLGGVLIAGYGWASIFWISVPIGVIALVGTVATIPESSDPRHAALDPVGQVLGVAALATLSYGLIRWGRGGLGDAVSLASLALAAVLLVGFVLAELRHPRPMLPVRMFADRHFATVNLASAALGFGPYAVYTFLSVFMQQTQHLSALWAGIALVPLSLPTATLAPVAGRWVNRSGPYAPLYAGFGCAAVGIAAVALLRADTPYGITAAALVLIGTAMAFTMTPTTNAALSAVPRERSGVASAIVNTTRQTGLTVGVALLGAVIAGHDSATTGLHVAAIIAAATAVIVLALLVVNRAASVKAAALASTGR